MDGKYLLAAFLVAAASTAAAQDSAAPEPQPYEQTVPVESAEPAAPPPPVEAPDTVKLEDVVVTANKRKESTRSLAGAVTAITRDRLDEAGASSMAEYLSLSPGVNFDNGVPGYSVVTIRGVSSDTIPGYSQSAVGMYYDDVPMSDPAAPLVVPDIDAFDADRIEVLHGPQGALYGSASMGGAVNYIPASPALDTWSFAADATGDLTKNSTLGGSGKLMLNVPLFGSSTAARVVGYTTYQPGYIDNLGTGVDHANLVRTSGGRAILGWSPTDTMSLKLSGLYQRTTVADSGYVDESLGDLKKQTLVAEPSSNNLWLAEARYEWSTDFGTLAFVGAYQRKGMSLFYDGASALGAQAAGQQFPLTQNGSTHGYSGELRFVSPAGESFKWLAGLSYARHAEWFDAELESATASAATGALLNLLQQLAVPPSQLTSATKVFREDAYIQAPETALFFEGTYRWRALSFTAGGRGYRNVVLSTTDGQGLLLLPLGSTEVVSSDRQAVTGFNPKVSLAWDVAHDVMAYALYSRGYRLGGPNLVPVTPLTSATQFYRPDEVRNYEVGAKTRWFDGLLTFDVAGYIIDWKNIPLVVQDSAGLFKYAENVGNARIKGVETSIAARPLSFLTARSAVTYNDSRLLNDYDPHNNQPPAKAGDHLPGAPEWTLTNSLLATWYWDAHYPSFTLIHRYVGGASSNLSFPQIQTGKYTLLDARAGLKFGGLGLTLFGKNLTDRRAISAINNQPQSNGNIDSLKFLSPPRSFGIELNYALE
jgi:outer membrane receptor protein involved in Fe transport